MSRCAKCGCEKESPFDGKTVIHDEARCGSLAATSGSAALLEVGVCLWCQSKLNWPRECEHPSGTCTLLCAVCRQHHSGSYWLVAPPGVVLLPAAAKRVKPKMN